MDKDRRRPPPPVKPGEGSRPRTPNPRLTALKAARAQRGERVPDAADTPQVRTPRREARPEPGDDGGPTAQLHDSCRALLDVDRTVQPRVEPKVCAGGARAPGPRSRGRV